MHAYSKDSLGNTSSRCYRAPLKAVFPKGIRRFGASALGLVHLQTSRPSRLKGPAVVLIDQHQARFKRLKTSLITSARLHEEQTKRNGFRVYSVFQTLTYADVDGWQPDHISNYMHIVRKHLERRGVSVRYEWKAELQKRGAVHYHVIWWLPCGVILPKPDKAGWWPHGLTNTERARNPVSYIAKYCSKPESRSLPKGIRLYAVAGHDDFGKREMRYWRLPKYVRSVSSIDELPLKVTGGWLSVQTGEVLTSPYLWCQSVNGVTVLRHRHARSNDAGGWSMPS